MVGIIDTHTHICASHFEEDREQVIQNALQAGVSRLLVVATNFEEAAIAKLWKQQYPMLDLAMGFHPTELNDLQEQDWQQLEQLLEDPDFVAVGEIGLDYYWDEVHPDVQKQAFIRQLQLANKLQKPVLIHMREATHDTIELVKQYGHTKGIFHCYTGSVESARILVKLGYHLSLAGPLTFKNANHLLDVAKEVPTEFLFVETDAPYLTPHPFRGKRNEPAYVTYTFEKLCELKQVDPEMVKAMMWEQYFTLFHQGEPTQ